MANDGRNEMAALPAGESDGFSEQTLTIPKIPRVGGGGGVLRRGLRARKTARYFPKSTKAGWWFWGVLAPTNFRGILVIP